MMEVKHTDCVPNNNWSISHTEFTCSSFHCAMEPMPASSNPISSSGRKSPSLPLHMLAKLVVGLDEGDGGLTFGKWEIKTKEEATSALNSGRTHLFA